MLTAKNLNVFVSEHVNVRQWMTHTFQETIKVVWGLWQAWKTFLQMLLTELHHANVSFIQCPLCTSSCFVFFSPLNVRSSWITDSLNLTSSTGRLLVRINRNISCQFDCAAKLCSLDRTIIVWHWCFMITQRDNNPLCAFVFWLCSVRCYLLLLLSLMILCYRFDIQCSRIAKKKCFWFF